MTSVDGTVAPTPPTDAADGQPLDPGGQGAADAGAARVHAFRDDALGRHDAVALADLVRRGEVNPAELAAAAIERAASVDPALAAIETPMYGSPRSADAPEARLHGVPTFVKDNRSLVGVPTGNGSEAYRPHPAPADSPFVTQLLSTGLAVLGKTRMPEFGLNASTEFMTGEPTRNPWRPTHSVGASSGGSAALVAAGVVPVAHANDGGGSIRIPAACAGLVGLKPTRHRHLVEPTEKLLPINLVSDGIVSRSVRDTATFLAGIEDHHRDPRLVPVGLVEGPAQRRLRVGLVEDSFVGETDDDTRAAVRRAAATLEAAGHVVEPIDLPVDASFVDDFVQYWGFLAELLLDSGKVTLDRSWDIGRADALNVWLRRQHRRRAHRTPGAIRRLRKVAGAYAGMFAHHEVVLSPVLAHTTPELGYLSPTIGGEVLMERLARYVSFTPINNIAGTPAMSVPMGLTDLGLPIGVHLQGAHGDERTLLEIAFLLEAEHPFARIDA